MARTPPQDGPLREAWPLRTFLDLAPLPTAVPCAVLHAYMVTGEWRLSRLQGAVELAVTVLADSGVRACAETTGRPPVRLRVLSDGVRVLIVVQDARPGPPFQLTADEVDYTPLLVAQLDASWGWAPSPGGGKLCWCLLR